MDAERKDDWRADTAMAQGTPREDGAYLTVAVVVVVADGGRSFCPSTVVADMNARAVQRVPDVPRVKAEWWWMRRHRMAQMALWT